MALTDRNKKIQPVADNATSATVIRIILMLLTAVLLLTAAHFSTSIALSKELSLLNRINQSSHNEFTLLLRMSTGLDYLVNSTEPNQALHQTVTNDILSILSQLEELNKNRLTNIAQLNKYGYLTFFSGIDPQNFTISDKLQYLITWLSDYLENWQTLIAQGNLVEAKPLQSAYLNKLFLKNYLTRQSTIINSKIEENASKKRWALFAFTGFLLLASLLFYYLIVIPSVKKASRAEHERLARSHMRATLLSISEELSKDKSLLSLSMGMLKNRIYQVVTQQLQLLKYQVEEHISPHDASHCVTQTMIIKDWNPGTGTSSVFELPIVWPSVYDAMAEDRAMFEQHIASLAQFYRDVKLRILVEDERDRYYNYVLAAVKSLPVAIAIFSKKGKVVLTNRKFDFEMGLTDLASKHLTLNSLQSTACDLMSNSDQATIFSPGKNRTEEVYYNERIVQWGRFEIEQFGWIFTGNDVTLERKQIEKIEHGRRLETLGKISGGIAHDINNYLAVIVNSIELANITTDAENRELLLNESLIACSDAARVNEQLLSYARKQNLIWSRISCNEIFNQVRGFLEHCNRLDDLQWSADMETEITADRSHLISSIFNILRNSCEASSAGTPLEVSIRKTKVGNDSFHSIEVTDHGSGFEKLSLPEVVEPFYTTKTAGTGLGLSAVHGFVSQSKGYLYIENGDEGATVRMLLPICDDVRDHREHSLTTRSEGTSKPCHILLVDDNPVLLDTLTKLLQSYDFDVTVADSVKSAGKLLSTNPQVDMVISDIVLLDGNGFDVVRQARALSPSVNHIFISGYLSENYSSQLREFPGPMLKKPFHHGELLKVIDFLTHPKKNRKAVHSEISVTS